MASPTRDHLPALMLLVAAALAVGCGEQGKQSSQPANSNPNPAQSAQPKVDVERLRPTVTSFCGDCHPLPLATSFAKADWRKEVERGYDLYRASGRQDLAVPEMAEVVAFYESQAPDKLEFPKPSVADHSSPFRFRTQIGLIPAGGKEAGVSSLLWHAAGEGEPGKLLLCDMHSGLVGDIELSFEPEFRQLAALKHASLLEPADLDGDGKVDYLVGELGSYLPQDHQLGQVVWLRPEGSGWSTHVLLRGVGRVAHAIDGDFDGDGEVDVLAAEFGWIETGKIHLLRRQGEDAGVPQFEARIVDPRHGASHLRKVDWDGDGDLDFVALISQEHEKVELFLNDGAGNFEIQTIFAATDPNFGASGIELVDLDGDGDLDILLTNGDAVDSFQVKPFHSIRWLENRGTFPFTEHVLTNMPGVYKAVAGDFDGDGDLDIAALAFPPEAARMQPGQPKPRYDLLVMLEQTEPGKFVRHPVSVPMGGLALACGDFDGDGDLDLATGHFGHSQTGLWFTIWWNRHR